MSEELDQLQELAAKQPHLEMVLGALDRLSDPVIIAGADGNISFMNSQAELVFGYNRAELIGQKVDVLVPMDKREIHEKHREDFWKIPRVRSMGVGKQL